MPDVWHPFWWWSILEYWVVCCSSLYVYPVISLCFLAMVVWSGRDLDIPPASVYLRISRSSFCVFLFVISTPHFWVWMTWIIDRRVCCVSRSCPGVEVKNFMAWQRIDVLSWLPVWELGVMSAGYLKFSQTVEFSTKPLNLTWLLRSILQKRSAVFSVSVCAIWLRGPILDI